MTVNALLPVVRGVGGSLASVQGKYLENTARAGGNVLSSIFFQVTQGEQALEFVNQALIAGGRTSLPWPAKAVAYFSPILLGIAQSMEGIPELFHPLFVGLHNSMGTLYHVAILVSSVALIVFGQTAFGASSLLILTMGCLDRYDVLPLSCQYGLHQVMPLILSATSAILGGWRNWIMSPWYFLSWGASLYTAKHLALPPVSPLPNKRLDLATIKGALDGTLCFVVNHDHLFHRPEMPEALQIRLCSDSPLQVEAMATVQQESVSLRDKILHELKNAQSQWMTRFYEGIEIPTVPIVDRYIRRLFQDCFYPQFGLETKAIIQCDTPMDSVAKAWILLIFKETLSQNFWETYDDVNVLYWRLAQWDKKEVKAFWREWIERQVTSGTIGQDRATAMTKTLNDSNTLFDQPLWDERGDLHPIFLRLMLYDMGILNKENDPRTVVYPVV